MTAHLLGERPSTDDAARLVITPMTYCSPNPVWRGHRALADRVLAAARPPVPLGDVSRIVVTEWGATVVFLLRDRRTGLPLVDKDTGGPALREVHVRGEFLPRWMTKGL
jgi:hypothetical protein